MGNSDIICDLQTYKPNKTHRLATETAVIGSAGCTAEAAIGPLYCLKKMPFPEKCENTKD